MSKPTIPTDFDRNDDIDARRQLQHELNDSLAQRLVEEAGPGTKTAMLSAVNGKWHDVMKDVRRGRITYEQALQIIDALYRVRLITSMLTEVLRERAWEADFQWSISQAFGHPFDEANLDSRPSEETQ